MALVGFLIRRILSGFVVLWLVGTPGVLPVLRQARSRRRPAAGWAMRRPPQPINEITRNLGLNQPILTQYWHFLDRGARQPRAVVLHRRVGGQIVGRDLPRTVSLVVGAGCCGCSWAWPWAS